VGNANYDPSPQDWGMSFLKLNLSLTVYDWFTPANWKQWSDLDLDTGSVGPVILPGSNQGLIFAGGTKYGKGHLVTATNMGHFNGGIDSCIQTIDMGEQDSVGQNPVAFNTSNSIFIYTWGPNNDLYQLRVLNNTLSPAYPYQQFYDKSGGSLCLSSFRDSNGILWAVGSNGIIHALDATNVSIKLWNSNMNVRDNLGSVGHFEFPTVANGKLYVGTGDAKIAVYGLLQTQAAVQLAFIIQPTAIKGVIGTVQVAFRNGQAQTVTDATFSVTMYLQNSNSTQLLGSTSVAAVHGIATFTNLVVSKEGIGYLLVAVSAKMTQAISQSFDVHF